jgi:hypothetical protein
VVWWEQISLFRTLRMACWVPLLIGMSSHVAGGGRRLDSLRHASRPRELTHVQRFPSPPSNEPSILANCLSYTMYSHSIIAERCGGSKEAALVSAHRLRKPCVIRRRPAAVNAATKTPQTRSCAYFVAPRTRLMQLLVVFHSVRVALCHMFVHRVHLQRISAQPSALQRHQ